MKKTLSTLLIIAALTVPFIPSIDSYSGSNSKLLVIEESINTFNIESLYKIKC